MDVTPVLTRFVSDELLGDDRPLSADEDLLADDMIDSLGIMRLVAFIEMELGYRVPPADLTIENFRTLGLLAGYLQRSMGNGADRDGDA